MYENALCLMTHLTLYLKLYTFEKKTVPDNEDDKEIFLEALSKYGVSLKQYLTQFETSRKRPNEDSPPAV